MVRCVGLCFIARLLGQQPRPTHRSSNVRSGVMLSAIPVPAIMATRTTQPAIISALGFGASAGENRVTISPRGPARLEARQKMPLFP